MVAADYPFLEIRRTMLIFFLWIAWFWLLITVSRTPSVGTTSRAARRRSGSIFVILSPFLGGFVCLISQGDDMAKRNIEKARGAAGPRWTIRAHHRRQRGGAAAKIEKAKGLLDRPRSRGRVDAHQAEGAGAGVNGERSSDGRDPTSRLPCFAFPGNQFRGEIRSCHSGAIEAGTIRVIDIYVRREERRRRGGRDGAHGPRSRRWRRRSRAAASRSEAFSTRTT